MGDIRDICSASVVVIDGGALPSFYIIHGQFLSINWCPCMDVDGKRGTYHISNSSLPRPIKHLVEHRPPCRRLTLEMRPGEPRRQVPEDRERLDEVLARDAHFREDMKRAFHECDVRVSIGIIVIDLDTICDSQNRRAEQTIRRSGIVQEWEMERREGRTVGCDGRGSWGPR